MEGERMNTKMKIPNGYFQGLELNKNPAYKNVNTSGVVTIQPKADSRSIFSTIVQGYYRIKKSILG